ncbi:MAG: T9SS type A sorting domain-containing protein, partial [Candidatus Cloacimonetes bacterium]|nr:T9SS type A sorting domain-containing protein [Candidatus Cloacimonadota bacterium]
NGVVSESDAVASNGNNRSEVIGRAHTLRSSSQFEAEVAFDSRREAPVATTSNSRALAGYTVYRDCTEIADIADPAILLYLDESLDAGTYEYTLEAYYTSPDGISVLTDPVSAIVVLNPPVDLDASSQPPNIILTWAAPNRGIDSYNVYRDGVLHEEGVSGLMFIDVAPPYNNWVYEVSAVYDGGWESDLSDSAYIVGGVDAEDVLPLQTELTGNYPNPFNPTTTISFSLAEASKVSISIYNMRGQLVKTLVNTELENDYYEIVWNGRDNSGKNTASGIYFYKMKAGSFTSIKKMVLMK